MTFPLPLTPSPRTPWCLWWTALASNGRQEMERKPLVATGWTAWTGPLFFNLRKEKEREERCAVPTMSNANKTVKEIAVRAVQGVGGAKSLSALGGSTGWGRRAHLREIPENFLALFFKAATRRSPNGR